MEVGDTDSAWPFPLHFWDRDLENGRGGIRVPGRVFELYPEVRKVRGGNFTVLNGWKKRMIRKSRLSPSGSGCERLRANLTYPDELEGLDLSVLLLDPPKHSKPVKHARHTIPRPHEYLRGFLCVDLSTSYMRLLVEFWWHRHRQSRRRFSVS